MFNLLRNCQTVFHSDCTIFNSHQQYMKVPISPQLCQHLLFSVSLILAILVSVKWYLTVIFDLVVSSKSESLKMLPPWAFLVAQWLRIRLPMQGRQVQALVREDPTCLGAAKPMRHNSWACALELTSHHYWARLPRACAPQQERPAQWEAHTPQWRVAPARCNWRSPRTATKTQHSQKLIN